MIYVHKIHSSYRTSGCEVNRRFTATHAIPVYYVLHKALVISLILFSLNLDAEEVGVRLPKEKAEIQLNMANELYAREMYSLASEAYKKFLRLKASLIHARRDEGFYRFGECLIKLERLNEAVSPFDQLLRNHPDSRFFKNALFRRGSLRFVLNDPDKAIPDLEQLLRDLASKEENKAVISTSKKADLEALLIPTMYFLGRAYHAKDRSEEASPLLERVTKESSSEYRREALFFLSDIDYSQQKWESAISNFESYRKEYPEGKEIPLVNLRLGKIFRALKKYDEAIKSFARIPKGHPHSSDARYLEIASLYQQKKYLEVLKGFSKIEKLYPESHLYRKDEQFGSALYMTGDAHFRLEQYQEVIQRVQLLLDLFPEHPERERARWMYCMSTYYQQDFAMMERSCTIFFKEFPQSKKFLNDVNYVYADAFFGLKRFDEAISFYKKVPPENEFHQEASYRIARSYLNLSVDKEPRIKTEIEAKAAAAFDAFVIEYPKTKEAPKSLLRAAELYQNLEKYAEGERRFSNFLSTYEKMANPDEIEHALFSRGQCQLAQGKYEPMAISFVELLKRFPKTSKATYVHYWIGRNYEARKQWGNATQFYALTAKDSKNKFSDDAIHRLANCYYRIEEFDPAAEIFFEIIQNRPSIELNDDIFIWVADHFGLKERLRNSIQVYEQLLQVRPNTKWVERCLYKSHLHYFALKEWKKAAENGRQLFGTSDTKGSKKAGLEDVLFNSAYSLQQLKKYDEAEQLYIELIQQGAEPSILNEAEFWLGKLYLEQDKYRKAKDYFFRVGLLTQKFGAEGQYLAGICLFNLSKTAENGKDVDYLKNVLNLWEGKGERKGTIDFFSDSPFVLKIKELLPEIKKRIKELTEVRN